MRSGPATKDLVAETGEPKACPVCRTDAPLPFLSIDGRDYCRCDICEARFLDPRQHPSRAAEYAHYLHHENHPDNPGYRQFLSGLTDPLHVRLPAHSQGLDYGCGPGPALAAAPREAGHDVALYDLFIFPDPEPLERLYDFVTCSETVEHFHRPAGEFESAGRTCSPWWMARDHDRLPNERRSVQELALPHGPDPRRLLSEGHGAASGRQPRLVMRHPGHERDPDAEGYTGVWCGMTTWLHEQRLEAVSGVVLRSGARTLLDLGCGDGDFLTRLVSEPQIERIVGVDLCRNSLLRLRARLDALTETGTAQVELIHGSMTDDGAALTGFDCAILIETIEHTDPSRLSVLERAVFAEMRPRVIVITTPNAEFNPLLGVPPHRFRHPDHRFEWDRAKFCRWAEGVATRHSYDVACSDIAGRHPSRGGASQMAVFRVA